MTPTAGTIARTMVLIVALVNQICAASGHTLIAVADDTLYDAVSTVVTVVSALVAWWKNNSISYAALKGDELMRELKKK